MDWLDDSRTVLIYVIHRFLFYVFDFYEAAKINLNVCDENLIKKSSPNFASNIKRI